MSEHCRFSCPIFIVNMKLGIAVCFGADVRCALPRLETCIVQLRVLLNVEVYSTNECLKDDE